MLANNGTHVSNYVIIDDMDNMLPEQQSHFVQTNPEIGITKEDSEKVIKILNKELNIRENINKNIKIF